MQLFALAYNLGNFLRRLALPRSVKHWSLTTLREKLIKIGAKVIRHARYVVFQMAEVAVPRRLFQTILLGTDSAAEIAADGGAMTASTVETAGEGGGNADGLRGSPMNAPTQGVLGGIIAWQRPDAPSAEHKECLLISRSAIDLSERPTAVVGRRRSGKSQLRWAVCRRSRPVPRC